MATTLCLMNQKGGSGKSSTCFHLAGAFAAAQLDVLLVDVDPQGSLTQGFLGSEATESLATKETVVPLFDESVLLPSGSYLIRPTPHNKIALCPANLELAIYNRPSPETAGLAQFLLRDFLQEAAWEFDVVLIDCPPNLYLCSWAAMIAADYVIIPVPPEDFGTQGLRAVHHTMQQARRLNPHLKELGHLVTRCDRRLLIHRSYQQRLRELYSDRVLETVIPEASAFKVALACRQPVEMFRPSSKAARLTRTLACEILDRTTERITGRHVA